MTIQTLKIKNFKSIKSMKLDCKRINLFIGQPNVGKSNILEAIGLLSFIGNGKQENIDGFLRFENFRDIL